MDSISSRVLNVGAEPLSQLNSTRGLFAGYQSGGVATIPDISECLEQCLAATKVCPMLSGDEQEAVVVDQIKHGVVIAKEAADDIKDYVNPGTPLSKEQIASIHLYSQETDPKEVNSLYAILNRALRSEDRKSVTPYVPLIWLLMTALSCCPESSARTVHRGVRGNLKDQYKKGRKITWYQFSSCTSEIEVLKNPMFVGSEGVRTLFSIELTTNRARSIAEFSAVRNECEVLLPPNTRLEVLSTLEVGSDLTIIQLRELEPLDPILEFRVSDKARNEMTKQGAKTKLEVAGVTDKQEEADSLGSAAKSLMPISGASGTQDKAKGVAELQIWIEKSFQHVFDEIQRNALLDVLVKNDVTLPILLGLQDTDSELKELGLNFGQLRAMRQALNECRHVRESSLALAKKEAEEIAKQAESTMMQKVQPEAQPEAKRAERERHEQDAVQGETQESKVPIHCCVGKGSVGAVQALVGDKVAEHTGHQGKRVGGDSDGVRDGVGKPPAPTQDKAPTVAPQDFEFNLDKFKGLMTQVRSGSSDQKARAAIQLQTMANDSNSQKLMAKNGAIPPLVTLLECGDIKIQASAAGALWNLAANEQNKLAIAVAGAVEPLVAMLSSGVREAELSAAGALQNLCVNPKNKKTVVAAGGIEAFIKLLGHNDHHVQAKAAGALQAQASAAGALHNLAVNNDEAQDAIARAGAVAPLVALMQAGSPDLQAMAAATVWSIAGREDNRRRIVVEGGIPPLTLMLQSSHRGCQAKASGAIRCLTMSASIRPEFVKRGVIPHLLALLTSDDQDITINAAGALENLGCR